MPIWNKLYLQDRNSPLIEHLSFFHDHTIVILSVITIITLIILIKSQISPHFNRFFLEAQTIELFWTTLPALMLIFIAIPSLKTLYLIEENINPLLSIKIIGFQWHWLYEYNNFNNIKINSLFTKSITTRLLETSNHLIVPNFTPTRILVTSKDVIHSWTIPSLGIKVDAIPGRINQNFIVIKRPGILIGQCSEICGAGHSFMPIILEAPSPKNFIKNLYFKWLKKQWPLKPIYSENS